MIGRTRKATVILVAIAGAMGAGACRKSTPAAPPPDERPGPLVVTKEGPWLFTHAGPDGRFSTVDKLDDIPPAARRLVRVIDPRKGALDRRDTAQVYVVDLAEVEKAGRAVAKTMSREAFETGALAQLPPGENSPLSARPEAPSGAASPGAPVDAGEALAPSDVVVTLYGTAWCGACRTARDYLRARKIPFADKDVEKDPAAARELADKARRLGVPADRVPILDVRGRLLIGFDQARLEAMLGEPT